MPGIVIVGAGHAGVQLSASLRESGWADNITLVTEESDLPYHKPPLSKSFMKSQDTPLQPLRAESFFVNKDISLKLGIEITSIERTNKQLLCTNGNTIDYDKLVLATGARARTLKLCGTELEGVHLLRTATDARNLREALQKTKNVAVIGGGFIGLEAAAMLASRGMNVDVIELAPSVLGRASSSILAEAVEEYLVEKGINLHLGQTIDSIEGRDNKASGVRLSDSFIPADTVLLGVGAEPVDDLARDAGLAVDNGVVVDAFLGTQDPDIFAIGDCASFPQFQTGLQLRLESVQNATDQARALALTMTGNKTRYTALPWFWSDIGELKLQIAGLFMGADDMLSTTSDDGKLKSVYHFKAGQLIATEAINSAGEFMLSRKLISEGLTLDRKVLESGDVASMKQAYKVMTDPGD